MTETTETTVVEPAVTGPTEQQQTSPVIHQRAFSIHIDNPLTGTPTCTFQQEKVVEINGEVIKQPIGELIVKYDHTDSDAVTLYDLLKAYYLRMIEPVSVESVAEEKMEPTLIEGVSTEETM